MNGTSRVLFAIAGRERDMARKGATSFLSPNSLQFSSPASFLKGLGRKHPFHLWNLELWIKYKRTSSATIAVAGPGTVRGGGKVDGRSRPGACLSNRFTPMVVD